MNSSLVFFFALTAFLVFFGCIQSQENPSQQCLKINTFAVSPDGNCQLFPTSCIPSSFTKVENCDAFLCQNIKCENKCQGFTFLSNGKCVKGNCIYESVEANSIKCGFVKQSSLDFETKLIKCFYSEYNDLFSFSFTVKNLSERQTKAKASVWILIPDLNKQSFIAVNKSYRQGKYLWENELKQPLSGQVFEIRDVNKFQAVNYSLYYCETDYHKEKCSEENGFLLFEGNTKDCEH